MRIKDADLCTQENLSNLFIKNDPDEIWNSKVARTVLTEENINWLLGLANWKVSVTLTFRDIKTRDVAYRYLRRLIQILNKNLIGNSYTHLVGHSYFSYAFGIEYQSRDVIHYHLVADRPLNFKLIHGWWGFTCGFAWTDIIRSADDCLSYIAKYNLKGGMVEFYKNKKWYSPDVKPDWWVDENIKGSYFGLTV